MAEKRFYRGRPLDIGTRLACCDCEYYDWDEKNKCSVGRPCTHPPEWGWKNRLSRYKAPSAPACASFKLRAGKPEHTCGECRWLHTYADGTSVCAEEFDRIKDYAEITVTETDPGRAACELWEARDAED